MDKQNASYWIKQLSLKPHPEGGYYNEVFRSKLQVITPGSIKVKPACTSIYYLLQENDFSAFHMINSDEMWYFHKGEPLLIHVINREGKYQTFELSDSSHGNLSVLVEAGLWFAAEIPSKFGFTLVSCAVAPGFDFAEFQIAEKAKLNACYPEYSALFNKFCR